MFDTQGAGKGKRVTTRSPEAAAQSGDALAVMGGGAQNTAEARVTSATAPDDSVVVKQEGGSGTAAGVGGLDDRRSSILALPFWRWLAGLDCHLVSTILRCCNLLQLTAAAITGEAAAGGGHAA